MHPIIQSIIISTRLSWIIYSFINKSSKIIDQPMLFSERA